MKNQLLEDIDDSKSRIPVPVRRVQAAPSQRQAQTQQDAEAAAPILPSGPAEPPGRQRAGVWRSRTPAPPPSPARHAAWTARPATAQAAPESPAAGAQPPGMLPGLDPGVAPDLASFSSREPDWTVPMPPEEAPWMDRWGRKVLGWTVGLAVFATVAATGAWMYRDTQVESTLAVVADNTQAQGQARVIGAPPAVPADEPVVAAEAVQPVEPEPSPLPPLRLLPPEPQAASQAAAQATTRADAVAVEAAPPAMADQATPRAAAAAARPDAPRVQKPAPKRTSERHVAAATPIKPTPQASKERVSAPRASQAAAQPPSESPLSETLRLCRAAGYHATACLKRGCEATRFGLVCRG